jgi:hypothetical protein
MNNNRSEDRSFVSRRGRTAFHASTLRGKFELARNKIRRWVETQENGIEQARHLAADARQAGDRAQCLAALQLAMQMQSELLRLFVPKNEPTKSKPAAETESAESGADDDEVPITPKTPDLSKMSDEEVARLAGSQGITPAPVSVERKPSSRPRGRSKGCEASGIAKIAKARAQERREREASEHPASEYNAVIALPVPIPTEWEE